MAKLSYYPEGVDLQGKQKIYFACHPDDFDIYFKLICDDLLADNRDCVIVYNSERNIPWNRKTMEFDLKEMRLMVIPVTTKFLCKPSEVRDVELPFITNNTKVKIPILPLMQESELDEEYKRVFYDLQYLDKNESIKDHTALPYDQKLKTYLDSVIFSPELVKNIREAFDAYIFMSYRKMDRVYAQELMKLIHKNDFCRDIAIWYDEFLTPGESFNHVIREALEKSKLFTLVVTPNILEPNDKGETNYVVQYEYPEAVKSGKPILPAEMVPTDLNALHEKLDNSTGEGDSFPTPTDGNDVEAISQALQDKLPQDLLDRLRTIAIDENNTDPQHNFFIGLAYLGGIDVEVDHEKAVQLITFAAEQNLPEAMEKLADMYKNGEGVERNYEISAEWLDKLVEFWNRRFEETGKEEDGIKLITAMGDSGKAWQNIGRSVHARVTYARLLVATGENCDRFGGIIHFSNLAVCYDKIGDTYEYEGNLSKAREFYEKSLEISKQLVKVSETPEFLRDLSISYDRLGVICESEGNLSEAKEFYKKSLEIREQLAKEAGAVESRQDLSISYDKMGDICRFDGNILEARALYEKSLEIRERLSHETETAESRRDLSISYEKIGNICESEGNLFEARKWHEKALEISKQLAEETQTIKSRRDLSVGYINIGNICKSCGDLVEAKMWYEKSLEIRKQLAEETETLEANEDLAASYFYIAIVDLSAVDIALLKKAEAINSDLVKQCPTVVRYANNLLIVRLMIDSAESQ